MSLPRARGHASASTPSAARWQLVDNVYRHLCQLSRALKGAAEKMRQGERPDAELMSSAGWVIVQASGESLVDSLYDLESLVPDSSVLIREYRARTSRRTGATASARPAEGAGTDAAAPGSTLHDDDWVWRYHVSKLRIELMLAAINRDGDAGEQEAVATERLLHRILAGVWEYLSNNLPASLSPEAAYIKNQVLPGVDPWLGHERDFVKAAWVLETLAAHVRQSRLGTDGPAPTGFVAIEQVRRSHPDITGAAFDRVRKNLETWRRSHEDDIHILDEDPNTGRRRYLYPLSVIERIVSRERRRHPSE